jgi:AmmeMemoRadiSam system protein B/AmmeMemoRadiSam system protein A
MRVLMDNLNVGDGNFSGAGQARTPAVAGSFYPDDPAILRRMIETMVAAARPVNVRPKALIVPHAGYIYSGPIAASAYAALAPIRDRIRRVVLLGPAHLVWLRGLGSVSVDAFLSPLGSVPVDREFVRGIESLSQVSANDEAHGPEHSLEVQLPFLQSVLGRFSLVPLVVGDASPEEVAEVLDAAWGGDETLLVISSDLSHYHDYETARRLDSATSRRIEQLDYTALGPEQACGCRAIAGLLLLARRRQLELKRLDLRNSGDTAGDRRRVVGYGAYALQSRSGNAAIAAHSGELLGVARDSIKTGLAEARMLAPEPTRFAAPLREPHAAFVTIQSSGRLRGCIGTTEPGEPLIQCVAGNAYRAAFRDPRFSPLSASEYPGIAISVSVLGERTALGFSERDELVGLLRPGVDGLLIESRGRRATFLPSVWENLPEPAEFLAQLQRKAGLQPAETPERAWRYEVLYFSD